MKPEQAKQDADKVKKVWTDVDPLKRMKPTNRLGDKNLIDSNFITPRIQSLKQYNDMTEMEREKANLAKKKPYEASTLAGHLDELNIFFDFIKSNDVCIFKFLFSYSISLDYRLARRQASLLQFMYIVLH